MSTDDEKCKRLADLVQRDLERAIFGDPAATANQLPGLRLRAQDVIAECNRQLRFARRARVAFVVDMAHPGSPIRYETPNEGLRVELSWRQASIVHEHWPLRLSKVLSAEAAEFVPASGLFGEWAPKQLPAPPYQLSPDDLDPRGR